MQTDGNTIILPPGSVPRIKLSGDPLQLKILGYHDFEAYVQYPDGHKRFHQCANVTDLLGKVSGQLKMRYNIDDFKFQVIPKGLNADETILIGEIKYA